MILKSWISLSKRPSSTATKSTKEAAIFISGIVLAFVFGVLPLPVILKWVGWLICFALIIYIAQAVVDPINRLSAKTRWFGMTVLLLVFIGGFTPIFRFQLREERASRQEGDLLGAGMVFTDSAARVMPMVQIGETIFVPLPSMKTHNIFPLFYDAGVTVETGLVGPLLSTVIRDRNGNLVAEINRNHWRVSLNTASTRTSPTRPLRSRIVPGT
jgi:hypothetical protein